LSNQNVPFRKQTIAFRLAPNQTYSAEFVMPGIGVLQFRNNNPFEADFKFEVYVHEKALFFERPLLYQLTRRSKIEFVPAKKIVKKF
jgi:hypothetical protein